MGCGASAPTQPGPPFRVLLEGNVQCRPLINKSPHLNVDYTRDPNIKALNGRGPIHHAKPETLAL